MHPTAQQPEPQQHTRGCPGDHSACSGLQGGTQGQLGPQAALFLGTGTYNPNFQEMTYHYRALTSLPKLFGEGAGVAAPSNQDKEGPAPGHAVLWWQPPRGLQGTVARHILSCAPSRW